LIHINKFVKRYTDTHTLYEREAVQGAVVSVEEIWARKSDIEIRDAAERFHEYTDVGQRVIRAEAERRGIPIDEAALAAPQLVASDQSTTPAPVLRRPSTYVLGAVTLLLAMVVADLATKATLGPGRSPMPLTWTLWSPCLVAIGSSGKRSERFMAVIVGSGVGVLVWAWGWRLSIIPWWLEPSLEAPSLRRA